MTRWAAIPIVILAVVVVGAACGDSGDGTDGTVPPPTGAATEATETRAGGGGCPDEPFTGTISRTAESETSAGVHVVSSRSDGELVSAYAFDFGTGDTYTVYVGDHEIDAAGVGSDTLVAPEGGMLATIFLISDSALEAGSELELRFVPIVDTGGGATITGFGADEVVGSATIVSVGGDRICFDIDTTDPQQTIDGTVSAEVVR